MKRKIILAVIFIIACGCSARAQTPQTPVLNIPRPYARAAANISFSGHSDCPALIKIILKDCRPRKFDLEHPRNSRITKYSL